MILLSKKRIIFILSTVMISILSVGLAYKIDIKKTVSTVALPVSGKVVILDARTSALQMNGAKC